MICNVWYVLVLNIFNYSSEDNDFKTVTTCSSYLAATIAAFANKKSKSIDLLLIPFHASEMDFTWGDEKWNNPKIEEMQWCEILQGERLIVQLYIHVIKSIYIYKIMIFVICLSWTFWNVSIQSVFQNLEFTLWLSSKRQELFMNYTKFMKISFIQISLQASLSTGLDES